MPGTTCRTIFVKYRTVDVSYAIIFVLLSFNALCCKRELMIIMVHEIDESNKFTCTFDIDGCIKQCMSGKELCDTLCCASSTVPLNSTTSLLLTCPCYVSLLYVIFFVPGATFTCSVLIVSFFATECIHLSILISFISSLCH